VLTSINNGDVSRMEDVVRNKEPMCDLWLIVASRSGDVNMVRWLISHGMEYF
jgi:hypothetical protein